jgi:cytochrome b pre-mRNA-processing protein 3
MQRLFRKPDRSAMEARNLYEALVARAREPVFYRGFSVPDTIDGRFDLLAIHAYLVMDALNAQGAAGARLGTELASIIFAGFDDALRELGVGDFGISRRIKAMANAFYGRLEAYRAADSEAALALALVRNLYRGDETREREAGVLAHYILSARSSLRSQADALSQGIADFGPLPAL